MKQASSNIRYLYFYTHIFCTPTKLKFEAIGCGVWWKDLNGLLQIPSLKLKQLLAM